MSKGLLLVNLGSPAQPETRAVRAYLTEFLTDPYVIDLPAPLRHLLVRGLIAPTRAPKSAHAYAKVWRPEGSPLLHFTREFARKVSARLAGDYDVRWAMRYGSPSLSDAVAGWHASDITVIPLYPQYAESSSRSAIDAAVEALGSGRRTQIIEDFFSAEEFIASEAAVIQRELDSYRADHLLFSFHGLPEHHMTKLHPEHCLRTQTCCAQVTAANRKCYRAQCLSTARALTAAVRFPKERISVSFQSRLGRRPWIKPYTDYEVTGLAQRGVRRLAVACPSFVADCLETLEEVQMRLKEQFLSEGGEDLRLIPALNDDELWVQNFCRMLKRMDTPAR